jgi:hypothetical protein
MLELFSAVFALGLASMASPGLLAISVAILAGKSHPAKKLLIFILGGIVTVILLALLSYAVWDDIFNISALAPYRNWITFGLGALLIIFGIISLMSSKERAQRISDPHLIMIFIISFILNITNLDAVLLNLSAVKLILSANLAFPIEIASVVFVDFFFVAPCVIPLLIYLVAPKRIEKILAPLQAFLKKYGRILVAAIFFIMGFYLIAAA